MILANMDLMTIALLWTLDLGAVWYVWKYC